MGCDLSTLYQIDGVRRVDPMPTRWGAIRPPCNVVTNDMTSKQMKAPIAEAAGQYERWRIGTHGHPSMQNNLMKSFQPQRLG